MVMKVPTSEPPTRDIQRADRDRRAEDTAADTLKSFGFGLLVDRIRNAGITDVLHGPSNVSPKLMFEATASEAPAGARTRLTGEEESGQPHSDIYRELRAASVRDVRKPDSAFPSRTPDSSASVSITEGRYGRNLHALSDTDAQPWPAMRSNPSPASGGRRGSEAMPTNRVGGTSPAPSSDGSGATAGPIAGTGSVAPVPAAQTNSGTSAGVSTAQQIGELLGATRTGAVESARAPSGTSAPNQGGESPVRTNDPGAPRANARPAQPANPGTTPGTKAVTESAKFDELIHSIRFRTGERISSARLNLIPPELGRIRVDVRVDGERVEIRVNTESEAAREVVANRAARLTAALEEHGLRVARFDIDAQLQSADRTDSSAPQEGSAETYAHSDTEGSWDGQFRWRGADSFDTAMQPDGPAGWGRVPADEADAVYSNLSWNVATESRLDITV